MKSADRQKRPLSMAQLPPLGRFIALYALLYAAFGVASPFLPAYIESRGVAPELIGFIFATGTAVRLLCAPAVGRIADRWEARRELLAACAITAALAALLYLALPGVSGILVASVLQAVGLAPLTPLADALALLTAAGGRSRHYRFEYGWVRGAGSAAFIVASIIAGAAVSSNGLASIVWLQAALLLTVPLASCLVSERGAEIRGRSPLSTPTVWTLLELRTFRRVVLVAALILGSHAMHDTFSVIRWSAADISARTMSLLWSASVAAEVIVFFVIGPRLVQFLGPAGAVALAALAGVARWSIAAITANVIAVACAQPLHGLTFALLHLACMRLIAANVPPQLAATAQAVYGTVGVGASSALLTLASGWLYARLGAQAFAVMAVLCLLALPLALALRERERRPDAPTPLTLAR